MDDGDGDQRADELSSLEAIFPEIQRLGDHGPFAFKIELPVNPVTPATVTFPAASTTAVTGPAAASGRPELPVDSHELAYFPSLTLELSLPEGYPSSNPPRVSLSTSPPWLSADIIRKVEDDMGRLWEDMGRDLVAFTYIDHVQQAAENLFGLADSSGALEIDPAHKIAILDYDIEARRAAFARETFDCGICLDPKKGSVCHKMLGCAHIFCLPCLQDFYNTAIKEGDLTSVKCLTPGCAKGRAGPQNQEIMNKRRKLKTMLSPSELLQMGLSQETVIRYVTLRYKVDLESDKNTIYCPRAWCSGAARSKRHKKPDGLEFEEASADESGTEHEDTASKKKMAFRAADLLSICEDCGFAFCSRCSVSWHGEFTRCASKPDDKGELSVEEAASLEYLKLHTTPCPTCAAPAQKSQGCNHMICFRCSAHFCYLCSAWLDPSNPYAHFNKRPSRFEEGSCYMRLWELEQGDGNDVGHGFVGGIPAPHPVPAQGQQGRALEVLQIAPEIEEPGDEEVNDGEAEDQVHNGDVDIAREGPLILRIGVNPQHQNRARRAAPPAAPAPPAGQHVVRARRGHNAAGRARQGGPGRGNGAARGRRGIGQNHNRQAQEHEVAGNGNGQEHRHGFVGGGADLNAAQEAWIRHFVRLALNDEEDSDSDSDDEMFGNVALLA